MTKMKLEVPLSTTRIPFSQHLLAGPLERASSPLQSMCINSAEGAAKRRGVKKPPKPAKGFSRGEKIESGLL
jgi:hypothetical protein